MTEPADNPPVDQHRPDQALTGVLPDQAAFDELIVDAEHSGIDPASVSVLHGPDGVKNFDLNGENHGTWARLVRSWKNMGGADADVLSGYDQALRDGQWVFRVDLAGSEVDAFADLARKRGASQLNYFFAGSMRSL